MRKTRALTRLLPAGIAAVAVAGTMIAVATLTGTNDHAAAQDTAVAGAAGAAGVAGGPGGTLAKPTTAPVKKTPKASKYHFQNTRPAVGSLAAGQEVRIAPGLFFTTRGTQWAVISRQPGEPAYEPFGWRQTVGNSNIGDGTDPGMQSVGGAVSSVFKSSQAATVVYTVGSKAWYGKVYRLAGIPGWVESSAQVSPVNPESTVQRAVFVYDAQGKLLKRFGDGTDPLAR